MLDINYVLLADQLYDSQTIESRILKTMFLEDMEFLELKTQNQLTLEAADSLETVLCFLYQLYCSLQL